MNETEKEIHGKENVKNKNLFKRYSQ